MSSGLREVSLRVVNNSEKSSLVKESMSFWDENAYFKDRINELVKEVDTEINNITTEILQSELDESSKQVASTV